MSKAYRYFPTLLLAAGVALASPACAAQIYGSGHPRGGVYNRDLDRRAYDNGLREGVKEGQNDARHNRDFSYQRHDGYRDADKGYRRDDGDREFYRRSYRQGFQAGYTEAYNRNARDGRDQRGVIHPPVATYPPASSRGYGSSGSMAAQNGYRDGLEAGRNSARDRERFDPVRAKRYREGDHDYDNRYGSRDDYKRDYRAAFEQGYREGYGRR
jgi:flagellar biosynthesis/type III secretory pathway protein FliH